MYLKTHFSTIRAKWFFTILSTTWKMFTDISKTFVNLLLQTSYQSEIWKRYMNFVFIVFIAYKNSEWCHSMVCVDFPALISFYCVQCFFFHFSNFFATLFVKSTASVILLRGVIYRFASRVWLFQPYLVISVTGSVQLGKNMSHILSLLVS